MGRTGAVMLGLAGEVPETVRPDEADGIVAGVSNGVLTLAGGQAIAFSSADIVFDRVSPTPRHPNTVGFTALDGSGEVLKAERWCSVGGALYCGKMSRRTLEQ